MDFVYVGLFILSFITLLKIIIILDMLEFETSGYTYILGNYTVLDEWKRRERISKRK